MSFSNPVIFEPDSGKELLSIRDLSVRFDKAEALRAVNLDVRQGEFIAVVGPSGCGKSTLLHVIAGFLQPTSGSAKLNGEEIRKPGADRTVVLQQPALFQWLNVYENVELGPKARGVPKAERHETVQKYLDLVGLSHVQKSHSYELSGGMQQRVSLARALANDTSILLVDEPFGALDALTRDRMQREIVRIWHETGKTVLFITHDVEEAVFCATSIVVMAASPGRVLEQHPAPFSRMYAEHDLGARAVKSRPDFIELREKILAQIVGEDLD
ncbi:MAG: ABC transporter ATP-binding protein [Geminicoccaceae bacterium]|nr:ABC transporter ATP-binding protein [Geminicoccaceae bacterium]MCB9943512.1 ABC transporter ATP-binding protein [Geminicoccaceae bacterium]